jgi:hypothetical protein
MHTLVARADAIKGKRSEKGGDNMLKIMSDGLKLATDIRLLDPDAVANPNGKLAKAVLNIHRIWEKGEDPGLAQIVFLDMGVPGSRARGAGDPVKASDAALGDDVVILPADSEEEAESDNLLLAGRFNLYEELRSQLTARGIPREQIAFIHEADNDVKKGRLFAAVRAGEIRILIGSTAKMGVGTNVQKRLVAMHHLDAPWRPADVEQRDGRILRQGNLNKDVEVFRYITEGSLDAYRWQTLNTKANFIAQLRAGARGVRSAEDIDSPLPEAAMIKAAASGDPRIMEHAELSKEARLLEAARRAHERSINAARSAHAQTLERIERLRGTIAQARDDAAEITDVSGDRFEATLSFGGQRRKLADRRNAGDAIRAHLLRVGGRHWDAAAARESLGELSGFRVDAMIRRSTGELQLAVLIERRLTYSRAEYFALTDGTDPIGLMRRFETLIKTVPLYLAARESELAKAETDLPRLVRQIEAGPFAKQAQLDAIKSRIAQLEKELTPKVAPADEVRQAIAALLSAGSDEAHFDEAFRAVQTNGAFDSGAAIAIARGFTGKDGGWPTREAALGAIESHFYQQSRREAAQGQAPARQSAGTR